MVKVLKTNSGYCLAFKDDVSLTEDEVRSYKAAEFSDPKAYHERADFCKKFPKADVMLTCYLMKEIANNIPKIKETNTNELAEDSNFRKRVLETAQRTGRKHCYSHYTIKTSDLPSDYNSYPVPIHRVEEFYFPKYDPQQQRYICCDESGYKIEINGERASFHTRKLQIDVHDKVFFFTPQEIEEIKRLNKEAKTWGKDFAGFSNFLSKQPKQIEKLYHFYIYISLEFLNKKQKLYSVNHELHHALTQQRINQRRQQPNYKELSPTNDYRFNEDNEKAAQLKETYLAIANFFQKGGDLSVFPDKCQWLVDKIKNLSFEQQKQILSDKAYIVNGNIKNWNTNYAEYYISQRYDTTRDNAWNTHVLRIEDGEEEYLARRSCAYTMDVYDPQTGKTEKQDLSKFIQIPTVIRSAERKYTDVSESIRRKRLNDLKQNGIDLKLVQSLLNGTYQEPFNVKSTQKLHEQYLMQGFSFQSKNSKGNPVLIEVKKCSTSNRPNCISLSCKRDNNLIFKCIVDEDKGEYNIYNFKNGKKYSNVAGTKHPSLPQEADKLIKRYLAEASQQITNRITLLTQNNNYHQ